MRRRIAASLAALLVFGSLSHVAAWGGDGHKTVGQIASLHVKPQTARRIQEILKPGETLASVSTWADNVKDRMGESDPDADTHAFLQDLVHNERNREWHYDDLPLNCTSYQACHDFAPGNDIVHVMEAALQTLRGVPQSNYPLSERNALRLLIHLVGDIHQPLHMACGFIDEDGPNGTIVIVKDPNTIRSKRLLHDRGGNQLIIDNDRRNLHGYWDFDLVKSLMTATRKPTPDELGNFLIRSVRRRAGWNSSGHVNTWPVQWANDSLLQSRQHAYRAVRITRKRIVPVMRDGKPVMRDDGQPQTSVVYDVIRPANYETANREIVRIQLAKAGFRLAKMLDAIYAKSR